MKFVFKRPKSTFTIDEMDIMEGDPLGQKHSAASASRSFEGGTTPSSPTFAL